MERRQRVAIALATGVAGFVTGLALFLTDLDFWTQGRDPAASRAMMIILGGSALGAFGAGLIVAPLFGLTGWQGWARAALGSVLATALGGAIGGTLVMPGFGTIWGVPFVFLSMLKRPLILPVWLLAMAGLQLLSARIRAGREAGSAR